MFGKGWFHGSSHSGRPFFLINENGEIITEAERVGELVYEGDNVTLGYAVRGEDLAKGDERHGRLETGDMAKFDKDGYFYIVGRKKRFLKIFGNRVNLDETERLIKDVSTKLIVLVPVETMPCIFSLRMRARLKKSETLSQKRVI